MLTFQNLSKLYNSCFSRAKFSNDLPLAVLSPSFKPVTQFQFVTKFHTLQITEILFFLHSGGRQREGRVKLSRMSHESSSGKIALKSDYLHDDNHILAGASFTCTR